MKPLHTNSNEITYSIIDDAMSIAVLSTSEDFEGIDFALANLNGVHSNRMNTRSVKLYHVLEGQIEFNYLDKKEIVKAGGLFILPPKVWCEMVGQNSRFAISCSPAFNPSDEVNV